MTLANLFGLSYMELNVILFRFLMPAAFIFMLYKISRQGKMLRIYKRLHGRIPESEL